MANTKRHDNGSVQSSSEGAKKGRTYEDGKRTYERRLRALDVILCSGFISLADLHEELGMKSGEKSMVRGDVRYLTEHVPYIMLFGRDHVFTLPPLTEASSRYSRARERTPEKAEAALRAHEEIDDGDCIFIGPGGTSVYLACEIAMRGTTDVQIITSTNDIVPILRNRIRALCLVGGALRAGGRLMVPLSSGWPNASGEELGKCFVGVESLSKDDGARCGGTDAEIQESAWRHAAGTVIFMTDHTEIGARVGTRFADFGDLEDGEVDYKIICGAVRGAATESKVLEQEREFGRERFVVTWVEDDS